MITDALLGMLLGFLNLVLSFFTTQADVPLNNSITSAVTVASGYYHALDAFLPFGTIFAIIAFDLTFEGVYFIYKLVRWAYQKVPMIN